MIATLLAAAVAVGTTAATLGAGLLAHYASWRVVFLLPALSALVAPAPWRRGPRPAAGACSS